MIRAVLWDLDGTLLNFKAAERAAIKKCFRAFGFGECSDEAVARYSAINTRHWEMLERGERTRAEILQGRFEQFLASCGADPTRAEAFNLAYEAALTDTVEFMPGAKETVEALHGRQRGRAAPEAGALRAGPVDGAHLHLGGAGGGETEQSVF